MAEITFFHYIHRDTVLHRMDGRLKLVCMLLISLSASFAPHYTIIYYYLAAPYCFTDRQTPLDGFVQGTKFWLIILLVISINAYTIPETISYLPPRPFTAGRCHRSTLCWSVDQHPSGLCGCHRHHIHKNIWECNRMVFTPGSFCPGDKNCHYGQSHFCLDPRAL